ncbi:hypothetical protein HXX76_011409 [Chlamydomonas incerta]|uniref:AB hydrolase-1 domain-containing protein n=1 Tax=Chlamydomonas incerta TaxID=51695 RepID=A0A835SUW3_CHLIN|nr:hypothetical protein HXX76_011409 [Chlamydomonas incerta]|eukprot:KAG2428704.1 hypothetical protein HXX76_011409 [Chlamydomonas incerta]
MAAGLAAASGSGAAVAASASGAPAAGGAGSQQHNPPDAPVAPDAFTLDQPATAVAGAPPDPSPGPSGRAARARLALPPLPVAAPHVKTHHYCVTPDGWRLHLVRTRAVPPPPAPAPAPAPALAPADANSSTRRNPQRPPQTPQQTPQQTLPAWRCPLVLVPGLGSSGAYTFDLSPVVSLADYLAARGWDVWVVELRGNGQSDRPSIWSGRSRWWSIDDYVTKDLPAVLRHVLRETRCAQAHVLGHSMGGMVLTRLLALGGEAAAGVASATVVASGCFLKGSWWQMLESTMWLARYLWIVPAGSTLRAYSPLALGRAGLPLLDELYFWPPNTDPALARAVLARNFSAISSGVILQIKSAFGPAGLLTADRKEAYADPARLSRVETPVLFVCGDRDRMCPPQGAAATAAMFRGARCRRYVELGPGAPPPGHTRTHYGHFDILMGRNAEEEVFPLLSDWLDEQDGGPADDEAAAAAAAASARSKAAAAAQASGHHRHHHHHQDHHAHHQPSHPPHHPAHPRHHSQHSQPEHSARGGGGGGDRSSGGGGDCGSGGGGDGAGPGGSGSGTSAAQQRPRHSGGGADAGDAADAAAAACAPAAAKAAAEPAIAMAAAAAGDPAWTLPSSGGHTAEAGAPAAGTSGVAGVGPGAGPLLPVLRSRL